MIIRISFISLVCILILSSFSFSETLFICDQGEIKVEDGDYSFGSTLLIYSDEGKTTVISDDKSLFHIINKNVFLRPIWSPDGGLNSPVVISSIEILINIDEKSGVINEVSEDGKSSGHPLTNCNR